MNRVPRSKTCLIKWTSVGFGGCGCPVRVGGWESGDVCWTV